MPPYDFFNKHFIFPKTTLPRPPPCTYGSNNKTWRKGGVTAMYEDFYDDYYDYYVRIFGKNPFEDMTEEEIEEFLRELYGDFEDDNRWSGRF